MLQQAVSLTTNPQQLKQLECIERWSAICRV